MFVGHSTVTSIFEEWNGLGNFEVGKYLHAYPGGIKGLEKDKRHWRRSHSSAESKHFSRLKMIINVVEGLVHNGDSLSEVLDKFDDLMKGKTLSTFCEWLKKNPQINQF
jgi:hypothetical protein